jgi:hypothetical protein
MRGLCGAPAMCLAWFFSVLHWMCSNTLYSTS